MEEKIIYIDSENLEKIAEVLGVYIKEEIDIIDEIKNSYEKLKDEYISDNSNLLDQLLTENILNLNKMKNNHDSNVFLIKSRIEQVRQAVEKNKKLDDAAKNG